MTKPGWQTTEFWLTLLVHLLTFLVQANIFPETHWAVKVATLALSGLAQLGYTSSRATVKTADAGPLPTPNVQQTLNVAPASVPPAPTNG